MGHHRSNPFHLLTATHTIILNVMWRGNKTSKEIRWKHCLFKIQTFQIRAALPNKAKDIDTRRKTPFSTTDILEISYILLQNNNKVIHFTQLRKDQIWRIARDLDE